MLGPLKLELTFIFYRNTSHCVPTVTQECGELFLVHSLLTQDHTRRRDAFATVIRRYGMLGPIKLELTFIFYRNTSHIVYPL
jgi:hypothetical protein